MNRTTVSNLSLPHTSFSKCFSGVKKIRTRYALCAKRNRTVFKHASGSSMSVLCCMDRLVLDGLYDAKFMSLRCLEHGAISPS
jgi:hypothetical protein